MIIHFKCQVCGKEVEKKVPQKREYQTCSKECRYESLKNTWEQKVPQEIRFCVGCGKEFKTYPAWLRKSGIRGRWCSKECRWNHEKKFTRKEKYTAVNKIRIALVQGRLQRQPCEVCSNEIVEAHHYKGYAEENWLNVKWLCKQHHNREHERLRQLGLTVS